MLQKNPPIVADFLFITICHHNTLKILITNFVLPKKKQIFTIPKQKTYK